MRGAVLTMAHCRSSLSAVSQPLPNATSHVCRPMLSGARPTLVVVVVFGVVVVVVVLSAAGGTGSGARRASRRKNLLHVQI